VFVKYEAEVSSRVSGGERGVVDFGKLFTETSEQKFSLGGVQCKKICSKGSIPVVVIVKKEADDNTRTLSSSLIAGFLPVKDGKKKEDTWGIST